MSREFSFDERGIMARGASLVMLNNSHGYIDQPVSGGHGAVLQRSSRIAARDLDRQLLGASDDALMALAAVHDKSVLELQDRQKVIDEAIRRQFLEAMENDG